MEKRQNLVVIGCIAGLGLVILPFFIGGYWVRVLTSMLMYGIIASALNMIAGYAGYPAFGNVVFFGLGAYTTGILMLRLGLYWWGGVILGGILASAFAVLLGSPMLRLKGFYFAVGTFGINRATEQMILNWSFTGGGKGITLPLPKMEIYHFCLMIYFIMLGLLLLALLTSFLISRSRLGYALRAIRDNEDAAEASGIFAPTCKVIAWAISAFFTGLVGGIFAYWFSFIEPSTVFDIAISIKVFVMMMLGGAGTVWGPVFGAFLIELISETVWGRFLTIHMLILGMIMIGVVILIPKGILDAFRKKFSFAALWQNLENQKV